MTEPLSLDTILTEFSDDYEAWVLQDRETEQYVVIPDDRFPGRKPIRFFMKRGDAEALLIELIEVNPVLRDRDIFPVKVNLKQAIHRIASDTNPQHADAFIVHSPNEVYEWMRDQRT